MPKRPSIRVVRIYEIDPRGDLGHRVLVDRLWPRGISKVDAMWDEWCKDIAPTTELRRWYDHEGPRFEEFAGRYVAELRRPPASTAFAKLLELARSEAITLLTATRDVDHSAAHVLGCQLIQAAVT